MKLKIAFVAFALAVSSATAAKDIAQPADSPEFTRGIVNKNPFEQLEVAKKLVVVYCNQVTTIDGRNSLFNNAATCRSEVMYAYMAKLLADTAPYAQFKEVEKEGK